MNNMSDKMWFILEVISIVIAILLLPFADNKIMYALGFGLFFAGGMGLIMRLINKLKKKKQLI